MSEWIYIFSLFFFLFKQQKLFPHPLLVLFFILTVQLVFRKSKTWRRNKNYSFIVAGLFFFVCVVSSLWMKKKIRKNKCTHVLWRCMYGSLHVNVSNFFITSHPITFNRYLFYFSQNTSQEMLNFILCNEIRHLRLRDFR